MSSPEEKKNEESPLQKSINESEDKGNRSWDKPIQYGNEDRQIVKDQLPPVFPDSDDDE